MRLEIEYWLVTLETGYQCSFDKVFVLDDRLNVQLASLLVGMKCDSVVRLVSEIVVRPLGNIYEYH